MAPSVYKICACRDQVRCRHPFWFSVKQRGTAFRLRKSLDIVLEKHIDSKTVAEQEANRLRIGIIDTLADPSCTKLPARTRELLGLSAPPATSVLQTLTISQLLETYKQRHLARTATIEKRTYEIGAIVRTVLPRPDGTSAPLGEWLAADVTADTLERLREVTSVRGTRKSGKRVTVLGGPVAANRNLRMLRAAFNWSIDKTLIDKTPFKRGDRTTVKLTRERARSRRLQEGEGERLLKACGPFVRLVVEAAIECGARRGELLNLQWHQVQFTPKPELWFPAGKTKTARPRRVPISTRLQSILEMRRDTLRAALELKDDEMLPGNLYVFGNELGQRHGAIKTAWMLACERAKIVDLEFRDLRRECGSRWMESGVPLATIQKWLGHASVAMTSVYLSTTTAGEHDAMRRYEERIGRLTPADTGGATPPHNQLQSDETADDSPRETAVRH